MSPGPAGAGRWPAAAGAFPGPRFGVLGPLLVRDAGGGIAVRQRLQRRALAALLVHGEAPCPREVLEDAVWGDAPPGDPGGALRTLLYSLRTVLGLPRGVLEASGGGWRLDIPAGRVDARVLAGLAARAREAWYEGDVTRAGELLGRALRLWRSPELDALDGIPGLGAACRLLRQEYRDVQDMHGWVLLARGRHAEAIAFLEGVTEGDPRRENAWAQLARATALAHGPAAASAVLARARGEMYRAAGSPPGPELAAVAAGLGPAPGGFWCPPGPEGGCAGG